MIMNNKLFRMKRKKKDSSSLRTIAVISFFAMAGVIVAALGSYGDINTVIPGNLTADWALAKVNSSDIQNPSWLLITDFTLAYTNITALQDNVSNLWTNASNQDARVKVTEDKFGTLTDTKWCTGTATGFQCTSNDPLFDDSVVYENITALQANVTDIKSNLSATQSRIAGVESDISDLNTNATDQHDLIAAIQADYYSNNGGIISGDVTIDGNFAVIGSYTNLNVTTVSVNGSLNPTITDIFYLGSGVFAWDGRYLKNLNASLLAFGVVSNDLIDSDTWATHTWVTERNYINATEVPAAETDSAHDTCAEISGCVVGAITSPGQPNIDGSNITSGVIPIARMPVDWLNKTYADTLYETTPYDDTDLWTNASFQAIRDAGFDSSINNLWINASDHEAKISDLYTNATGQNTRIKNTEDKFGTITTGQWCTGIVSGFVCTTANIGDGNLSANIPRLDSFNEFTNNVTFAKNVTSPIFRLSGGGCLTQNSSHIGLLGGGC